MYIIIHDAPLDNVSFHSKESVKNWRFCVSKKSFFGKVDE